MKTLRLLISAATLVSAAASAFAVETATEPVPVTLESLRVVGSDGTEQTVAPAQLSDVERYCGAIADPARDARAAMQAERLQALETQIDGRIDELEAKRAEYQEWLDKRQAFLESTSTIMLDIYAAMRPDAAAAQLAGLDRASAAAIIAKLKSRQASAILTEMPAPVASELAALIVARTDPGTAPGAAAGAASGAVVAEARS